MSNTKLDPRSLNAEERAIVDHQAFRYHSAWKPEDRYRTALDYCEPLILARRAIFGEPASEGKVEYLCPYCGVATDGPTHLRKLEHGAEWTCNRRCSNCHAPSGDHELCERCESILKRQPAQPESVAAEMPEAVREAARILRVASKGYVGFTVSFLNSKADALESFWRTHAAQPAKVRMTKELRRALDAAEAQAGWHMDQGRPKTFDEIDAAIAAVRARAAEAGKVRLPKVNEALWLLRKRAMEKKDLEVINEAQREVDAAEGRK